MRAIGFLLLFSLANTGWSSSVETNSKGRSFSIFSVVTFQNNQCTTTSSATTTAMQGTCYTPSECTSNGGTASGSCASGFGVCCMITTSTCGSTITKNVTYIQNPNFPSGFTASGTCVYTINTNSDICQIRLDMDTLVLGNVLTTPAGSVGACPTTDRLTVVGGGGSGLTANPPVMCGTLSGQHMYIETGRATTTGATITFASVGGANLNPARTWKVKVSMIECGTAWKAPTDCTQYYTGPSNRFTSYNYQAGAGGSLIQASNYHICFRQEEGFCGIQYTVVDPTTAITGFKLDATATAARMGCIAAELIIPTPYLTPAVSTDSYCGQIFSTTHGNSRSGVVTTYQTPFDIGVVVMGGTDQLANGGFSLMYNQVPC